MKKTDLKYKILHEILDWSKVIVTALSAAFLISNTLIVNSQVPTGSMEETIMPGSRIIINRLAYRTEEPKRKDIISFYFPDDGKTVFLKRIIALPGEQIEGIDGRVYFNGNVLDEPYVKEALNSDFGPFLVPDNSYFVMGDNCNKSWDSRYWEDKFVEIDEIIGKAEVEYFPELKLLN